MGFLAGASMAWGPVLFERDPQRFHLFFIFLAPHLLYLLLLFFVYKNLEVPALGLAAGLCAIPLIIGVPSLFVLGILSGGLDTGTARPLESLFPGALILTLGVIAGWIQSKHKGALAGAGMFGSFIVFLVLAGTWIAWSGNPVDTRRDMDREAIYKSFNHVHACNQAYYRDHPERGFARSLRQLGPEGANCLNASEVSGTVGNRKLLYEPGPAQRGPIVTYKLTTQPSWPFKDRYRLDSDQNGVTVYRGENGETDQLTFGSSRAVKELTRFSLCMTNIFRDEKSFPASFQAAARSDLCRNLLPRPEQTDFYHFENANTLVGADYEFRYSPLKQDSSSFIPDYRIDARPRYYGSDGVRSYVVSKDGVIHATPQDREARSSDPSDTRFEQ